MYPLEVHDITYIYADGTMALKEISFQLAHGQNTALIGANGSGKSTLLLHLNGLIPRQQGQIIINGKPLTAEYVGTVRQMIGLLFQNPEDQLFMPTVREDVAFGPQNLGLYGEILAQRLNQALGAVGLNPIQFLERSSFNLSLGEKKRVALAGLLAMEPQILLLDEPSAGLDPRGRKLLIALLQTLPQTKLIATHDLDLALETCTQTLLLENGVLVAQGTAEQILSNRLLLEKYGLELPLSLQSR